MLKVVRIMLLTALSAAGCRQAAGGPHDTGISDQKFVAVMVDLGLSQPRQRAAVLKKHGVSDAQLRNFVKAHEDYPAALGVVFDSIQVALDRKRLQEQ